MLGKPKKAMQKNTQMSLQERLLENKLTVISRKLKNQGFETNETLFLTSLYKVINRKVQKDPKTEPRTCHVFCDEIALVMSEMSPNKKAFSVGDVQGTIKTINEHPYKYIATNRAENFRGFRATDHFVKLIREDIGFGF